MKARTIVLAVIFFLLAGVIIYFFIGGTLSSQVQIMSAPASEYPDAYKSIVNVVQSGSAPIYFSQDSLSDSSKYTLLDVTIHLKNPGLFPAEWLEITTGGAPGDIAVYSLTGAGSTIDGRSNGQVNLKLITTANANAHRTCTLEYYVLGMKRAVQVSI